MKIILIMILFLVVLFGCEENERMTFVGKPGVYFETYRNDDTIKYSFRMTPYEKDTLLFDLKLMGEPLSAEKSFCLEVDPGSTAKAGVHYIALPSAVSFPMQKVKMKLPIVLCDMDKNLDNSSVFLRVNLKPSADIELGFPDNIVLNIVITNMLIKPVYWENNFIHWFGEYSKVKHEKCVEMMGHDFPLTYEDAKYWNSDKVNLTYWMFWGRKMADYFVKNPTNDENGNLIEPWEPN